MSFELRNDVRIIFRNDHVININGYNSNGGCCFVSEKRIIEFGLDETLGNVSIRELGKSLAGCLLETV